MAQSSTEHHICHICMKILTWTFICSCRTVRRTAGWFWHQTNWRDLNTSTEACWKSRWNWKCSYGCFVIESPIMHLLCLRLVHQQAAVRNASSVVHLRAASAHYVQLSSASSPARPSTTTSTASCRRRASLTFSHPIRRRMMELSLPPPTCNATDWSDNFTNWTDVCISKALSIATGWRQYIIFQAKITKIKYFIMLVTYIFI